MLNKMKVMHAPLEIAGQVGLICESLKKQGVHAVGYNYFPSYLNYNKLINADSYELVKILDYAVREYDVFHFHHSCTFLGDFADIRMIAEAGKKIVMHHRGDDVRSRVRASGWNGYTNPYVNADCSLPDAQIDKNLRFFARNVSAAIVQDHELYHYVADYYAAEGKPVYVLPRLIDLTAVKPPEEKITADPPLIVHAPTNRDFKGTAHILKAVDQLRKEVPLRFQLVEGMSHANALKLYRDADIVIDQVLCGAYGNLSVEAMALGKAVVCYIRSDLTDKYPKDLPIVSCHPDNLYDGLKTLVLNRELRKEKGRQGIAYVKNHHAADKVVLQLIRIYDEVWKGDKKHG